MCEDNDPKIKKKKLKKQCPCQRVKGRTESKPCQCCVCKGKKGKRKCDCHGKKKTVCSCPPTEPEEVIHEILPGPLVEIDPEIVRLLKEDFDKMDQAGLKDEFKLKSDMTQTTSGFKFKFKKRPPSPPPKRLSNEVLSFEDALQFFEDNPEAAALCVPEDFPDLAGFPEGQACTCDGPLSASPGPPPDSGTTGPQAPTVPKLPKNLTCACPELEEVILPEESEISLVKPEEPEPKGFKIMIGGKGTAAKGFAGIPCFEKCIK